MISAKVLSDSSFNGSRCVTMELEFPRCILAQVNTHRCIVGDSKLYFDLPDSVGKYKRVYTMTIESLCKKWNKGAKEHTCGSVDPEVQKAIQRIDLTKMYKPSELANLLGYKSPSNIHRYIREKRLKATKQGIGYLILGSDYVEFNKSLGLRTFPMKERLQNMYIRCVNSDTHLIEHTHVTDCWEVGTEDVYELSTESGKKIKATKDHPFLTEVGYVELQNLKVGDFVYTQAQGKESTQDANKFNKVNGQWVQTWCRKNKDFVSDRQNGLCKVCGKPLPKPFDLHHIVPRHVDISKAFDISNVIAVCPTCHKQLHQNQSTYNNTGAVLYTKPDKIISITYIGKETVYDLSVESDEHNFIANEFVVHNCFSRNTASSRAIPIATTIKLIETNPFIPTWTGNQAGMVGTEVDKETKIKADKVWLQAKDVMVSLAKVLSDLGIHKQNANRLLEPFSYVKTVVTSTEWDNFFNLRLASDAQPEIQELAQRMKEAINSSKPVKLTEDMAHTPYFNNGHSKIDDVDSILGSAACCAQVSYRKLNTEPEALDRIVTRLIGNGHIHASPFEHVCVGGSNGLGNLREYSQLRHGVEKLLDLGKIVPAIKDGSIWSPATLGND